MGFEITLTDGSKIRYRHVIRRADFCTCLDRVNSDGEVTQEVIEHIPTVNIRIIREFRDKPKRPLDGSPVPSRRL